MSASRISPPKLTSPSIDKYALYRAAVQHPEHDVELYQSFFRKLRGRRALSLREDFCGTFSLACSWVRSGPKQTALVLDLDPEPLDYGRTHYQSQLDEEQRKRLRVLRRDVMSVTRPVDLIVAGNFSFNIFKDRPTLVRYFRHCARSLKRGEGVLALDVAGGQGMLEKGVDRRTVRAPGIGRFVYEWETLGFDPITHNSRYAIHFKLKNGRKLRNAFTYDWRHWSIPEIRDAMAEAGFKKSAVFWDVSRDDRYERLVLKERTEDIHTFVAYVAGMV